MKFKKLKAQLFKVCTCLCGRNGICKAASVSIASHSSDVRLPLFTNRLHFQRQPFCSRPPSNLNLPSVTLTSDTASVQGKHHQILRRWRYNTEVIPKLKSNCNSIPQPTWPSCTFACRTVLWVHNLPTAPNMVASRPFISACLCVHHLLALGLRQAQYVFIGLLC